MQKSTFLIAIIIMISLSAHASDKSNSDIVRGKDITLKAGPFSYIQNAQLGAPRTFYNEMDGSNICYPLVIEGRQIAWIHRAIKTKNLFLFYKCEKYTEDIAKVPDAPKEAIHGRLHWESYTLKGSGRKLKLRKLNIPNYNDLSFDKYCDTLVAYWAYENDTLYAYVYDLRNKQLIFKQEIEKSRGDSFGTDDQGAFGEPKWNSNCTAVEFPKNYYIKDPITAEIKH